MGQMALQETLWCVHRQATTRANLGQRQRSRSGALRGLHRTRPTATALWMFTINGHQPAYPPNTINAYANPLPIGWAEANDARWTTDPYAETVAAYVNGALNAGTGSARDPERRRRGEHLRLQRQRHRAHLQSHRRHAGQRRRLHGRGQQQHLRAGHAARRPGHRAAHPRRHASAGRRTRRSHLGVVHPGHGRLPRLHAVRRRLRPRRLALYGDANGAAACGNSDGSTSQWAYIGLESAEVNGAPLRRLRQQPAQVPHRREPGEQPDRRPAAPAYRSGTATTSSSPAAPSWPRAGWACTSSSAATTRRRSPPTRSTTSTRRLHPRPLRQAYDNYLAYTAANWTSSNTRARGQATAGRPALAERRLSLRQRRRGLQRGALRQHLRDVLAPEGLPHRHAGADHGRRHNDWFRQFTIYYIRAQDRNSATTPTSAA